MNNKRILKMVLALVLCIPFTMLSACSSNPDGLSLMKDVVKEMKTIESMKMQMNMVMKMKVSMGENSLSMNMDANMDMDVNSDPLAYHGTMKMNMESLGQKQSTETEMYMVMDDTQMNQYQNDGSGWQKVSSNLSMDEISKLYSMDDELLEKIDLKVKNGEKIDKKETYRIDVTIDQDILKSLMKDELGDSDLDDLGLQDIELKYALFVDKDSKRLLKMEADFKDTFSKLTGSAILGSMLPEGSEIAFDDFNIELLLTDFNKEKEIVVPEDVVSEAEAGMTQIEDTNTYGDVNTQTHAWESYILNVDGSDITIGTSNLKTLLSMGYTIDETYEKVDKTIKKEESAYLTLVNGDRYLTVSVENKGNSKINVEDGIITFISVDQSNSASYLPGNIKIGSTLEEVKAAYGEANVMNSDVTTSWEYAVDTTDVYASLSIYFADGVVSDFTLGIY